jgi:hypothetical protein
MIRRARCRECGCLEGELHAIFPCFQEKCPFCGHQLVTCDCAFEKRLGQGRRWEQLLEKKGRVPFIVYPNVCARCGKLWPPMFMVPDEEWERYVEPAMRREIMCRECFTWIKKMIDGAARPPRGSRPTT